MRFLGALCAILLPALAIPAASAAVPAELAAAIEHFRPDPPRGWSFTQTTAGEGKSTVEHYDATKPEFDRWSLVQVDGRAPTADEAHDYMEKRSRWSRTGQAPRITDQLNPDSIEAVASEPGRAVFQARLRRGEKDDVTADFLRVTIVVHVPTHTISSIELASTGEFSPTFAVKIAEMKTLMTYALPSGETPSLPQKVETHLRGRAFWLKSLDADMTVTFSDFEKAKR